MGDLYVAMVKRRRKEKPKPKRSADGPSTNPELTSAPTSSPAASNDQGRHSGQNPPTPFWSAVRGFDNQSSDWWLDLLRWVLVACQLVTVIMTASLWQSRDFPPNLPVAWNPFPQFDLFWPIVASLVLALVVPRWGVIAHVVLLLVAIMQDQIRIQPQVVSCAILLLGTLPWRSWQTIARAHLFALWFYGGLHKLLSTRYFSDSNIISKTFETLTDGSLNHESSSVTFLHYLSPWIEIVLALMLLAVISRRWACVLAVVLHVTIFASLIVLQTNSSVWFWNIAVIAAAFALVWHWKESLFGNWKSLSWPLRIVVLWVLIAPLGYYFEWTDGYVAHCLYSNNGAEGYVVTTDGGEAKSKSIVQEVHAEINVPMPREHRLIEQYFLSCAPEDSFLLIEDKRLGAEQRGRKTRWLKRHRNGRRLVELETPAE